MPTNINFFEEFLNNGLASSRNWESFEVIFLKISSKVSGGKNISALLQLLAFLETNKYVV